MNLPLVSAIRYLEQNALPENEVISLDLWGDEGYDLQSLARQYEGATTLSDRHGFLGSPENPCKNSQLNCLMAEICEHDLAIQFIDSYPDYDKNGDRLNLRVLIMHHAPMIKALKQMDRDETAPPVPKMAGRPLLNGFKGSDGIRKTPRAAVARS